MSFSHALVNKKNIWLSKYSFESDIILHISFVAHIRSGWDGFHFHFSSPCSAVLAFIDISVLATPWCFGYCWAELTQHQGHLSNHHSEATGCRQARGLQRRQLGHLIWADSKDIPHCMHHTQSYKGGWEGEGRDIQGYGVCLLQELPCVPSPYSQKFTGHLSVCWYEMMNKVLLFFFPFACVFCFFN